MDADTVYENIRALSAHFATERRERQQRHELVAADFAIPHGVGPRVGESSLGKIAGFPYTAPFEDITIKGS
jgi:hypothetical protein